MTNCTGSDWEIWGEQKGAIVTEIDQITDKIEEWDFTHKPLLDQCQPKDPIVEAVINKLQQRSQVGFKKYKVSMADNTMNLKEWLLNLQEELMDATNYLERTLQELEINNKE